MTSSLFAVLICGFVPMETPQARARIAYVVDVFARKLKSSLLRGLGGDNRARHQNLARLCVTADTGKGYTGADPTRRRPLMTIQIRVECHAGYRAAERPLRFILRSRLFEVS